jgi:hypothetical protein
MPRMLVGTITLVVLLNILAGCGFQAPPTAQSTETPYGSPQDVLAETNGEPITRLDYWNARRDGLDHSGCRSIRTCSHRAPCAVTLIPTALQLRSRIPIDLGGKL